MAKPRKKTKNRSLKQVAFTRFMLVVAFFILWIGGISARLVHLQVNQHDWLRAQAMSQRTDVKQTRLPRGTIYDRNERALAMSINVKTLYANPMEIDDLPAAAKAISKVTGVHEAQFLKRLTEARDDERKFLPIVKGLDEPDVQRINKSLEDPAIKKTGTPKYAGLYWREEQKRSYPQQRLAAHVIGFSNDNGVGQAGIEQSQNELLYGAVIKKVQERDRHGRIYDETVSEKEPPKDVVLTLASSMQYKADEAVEKAVRASGARSGMAVVIDHKTGEILALSNYPTFDPNNLKEITKDNLTNRVIQSVYSPGSVFKLVTYGSALEKKLITPTGMIDSGNGTIEIAKHKFRDSHAIGSVTYSKALAHSSNVCAIKTATRVGKDDFYSMLQKLGFGKRTGIELPAETQGIVRNPAKWNGDSLASMSIGYEIGVTALQMVSAFATIANDGVRIQPHIIKEIRQGDKTLKIGLKNDETRVVSVEAARDLRGMLREVVVAGTGKRAEPSGFTAAGKTGTAWKFDEVTKRVSSSKYISSFIGFAPAENPIVTIGVIIDEPKFGGRDGGQVAGPAFREIAEGILPEMGLKPNSPVDEIVADVDYIPEATTADPNIKELPEDQPLSSKPAKKGAPAANVASRVTGKISADQDTRSPGKPVEPAKPTFGKPPKQAALLKNRTST